MQLLEGYLRTGMQLSALLAASLPTVCVVTRYCLAVVGYGVVIQNGFELPIGPP